MNASDLLKFNEMMENEDFEAFQRTEIGRLMGTLRDHNTVVIVNTPAFFNMNQPRNRGFLFLEEYTAKKIQKEIQAETSDDLSDVLARQKQKERKQ